MPLSERVDQVLLHLYKFREDLEWVLNTSLLKSEFLASQIICESACYLHE